jgi:hypothetical protein
MTHLAIDQLVALREPGLEPGLSAAREHLASCPICQAEAARIDQRSARLKSLPSLRPARDQWPIIQRKLAAERRRRRIRWVAIAGLTAAASIAAVVTVRSRDRHQGAAQLAIDSIMTRSSQLEQLIQSYNPDRRVTDGLTAGVAGQLEDRIAQVDQQLQTAQLRENRQSEAEMLRLWRQRVGLLDALVDVHLTRASQVGF